MVRETCPIRVFGFRVSCFGFEVSGSCPGFRVSGFGFQEVPVVGVSREENAVKGQRIVEGHLQRGNDTFREGSNRHLKTVKTRI